MEKYRVVPINGGLAYNIVGEDDRVVVEGWHGAYLEKECADLNKTKFPVPHEANLSVEGDNEILNRLLEVYGTMSNKGLTESEELEIMLEVARHLKELDEEITDLHKDAAGASI